MEKEIKVEIYTKGFCPYCARAKSLLDGKNIKYTEYEISMDADKKNEMITRSNGGRTVPQIFINDTPYGGFDDVNLLDRQGKLDAILGIG
ncbi:glutaredoxin 3 [Sphingorhabdus lutea]|uniref:Glutaredoxin n=1 Tax=Sphingorhabdus lutea TaxID=1913578 RepID=A0A1L3JCN8_9SPHN|nr:glutaredoxin 3 [Sphingorhabdus lutea]APG62890.1 glutaredoxin 3 [Sphingorhabdus lutea]